jgi:hypothetical protein
MKQIFYFFVCTLFSFGAFAQSPFWIETFSVGCNNGQVANGFNPSGMGTWSVTNTGTNNPESNVWYVSASEQGVGIGNCGQGCGGNQNRTLHVGVNLTNPFPLTDQGATYVAGAGYETDRRAESPMINCTGQNTITLTFAYILGGIAGTDYFNVQYSANGGTTWSVIGTPAITNNSVCGGQGLWTGYTVALPASANNNPNVKIGFRWVNSDPNGNDPSVAIDDVALTAVTPSTFAPTFTIASPICSGNSVTVMANTGTFAVSGYSWSASPAGPTIASPHASVTGITFPSSGTYSITLSATSGGTTATTVNTILVNATPVVTASLSPSMICSGQSSTLTGTGATSYTWNPGNLTTPSIVVSPTVTTVYTVTGVSNGCSATAIKTVVVGSTPVLTVTASSNTLCAGSSATLSATGAQSYTWNPGALTGSNVVVTPSASIIYTAMGTNTAACTGSAAISLTVSSCPTGLNQLTLNNSIYNVYPNPASDKIYIQTSGNALDASYEISDALGKTVAKSGLNGITQAINISQLPSGIYLVKITSGNETKALRFVKE